MEDLTGSLFVFLLASLFGLLVVPEWFGAVAIFGSQALITLGVWIAKTWVRSYLRHRRELREKDRRVEQSRLE